MGQRYQDDPRSYCDRCGEASDEDLCPECLAAHYRALLANPGWLATSGRVLHPLTRVPEADRVRADLEALAAELDELEDEETEARESDQDAYEMAVAAAGRR